MNCFDIGPFRLDGEARTVSLHGVPLALAPKAVETLLVLVERAGQVVSKDELFERIWPEGAVEEANLAQNVYVLRKALRAHADGEWIATVPRRGYRFTGPVREVREGGHEGSARAASRNPRAAWMAVFGALLLMLVPSAKGEVVAHRSTLSQPGAQAFALGRYYWNQRTKDGIVKSIRYFTEVVQHDPSNALGYAGLSEAYAMVPQYEVQSIPMKVAMTRAWSYAHQALAIDKDSAEGHAALGELLNTDEKSAPGGGKRELERAVALDPDNANAHLWLGVALYELGDRDGARAELETSERLEPAAPATESWLADVFFLDRNYDAAAEHLRRALEIDPNRSDALAQLGAVEVQRGAFSKALAADERFARSCKCGPYAELMNAYVYARMQRPERAQSALAHAERTMPRGKDESINVAFVYIALGDRAKALSALQRARVWEHGKTAYLAADPRFDPVREDPRFRRWTEARNS
jgi:DNA-binding winged helix-turn-helix (wHTH) protein/Flp pilus assembly protein TadD